MKINEVAIPDVVEQRSSRRRSSFQVVVGKVYPYGFKREAKATLRIAWPIAITQFLHYLIMFTSMLYAGRLGKISLDGAALALTIIHVFGFSVLAGLSTALNTLFTQIFGSENKFKIGVVLQRAVLIMSLTSLPCAAVFLNTESLLTIAGQDVEVAKEAGKFNTVFVFSLPGYVATIVLSKYLQAQSIVWPSLIIEIACNVFNAGLQGMLVFVLKTGIYGPAISTTLTQYLLAGLHLAFIYCSGAHRDTWNGWSIESLNEWKPFIRLAVPGFLMIAMEWWSYETLVFLSGLVSTTDLAANTIVINIANILYMGPIGLSVAACIRVGNHLGAGQPNKALTASRIALFMAVCLALFYAACILALKEFLPYLFTKERDVITLSTNLMYQLALFVGFDCMAATTGGILRGMGRQKFGAIVNFITYYLMALPISIPLLLATPLSVYGSWWGMMLGNGGAFIIFTLRIIVANWSKETEQAKLRTGIDMEIFVEPTDKHTTEVVGKEGNINLAYQSEVPETSDGSTPEVQADGNNVSERDRDEDGGAAPIEITMVLNHTSNDVKGSGQSNNTVGMSLRETDTDESNHTASFQKTVVNHRGSRSDCEKEKTETLHGNDGLPRVTRRSTSQLSSKDIRITRIVQTLVTVSFSVFLAASVALRVYLDVKHG